MKRLTAVYANTGNFLFAGILLWLVWPLFAHTSQNATVFGRYSFGYFLFLSTWILVILALGLTAVLASRKMNVVLFWTLLSAAAGLEAFARVRGWGGYYSSVADDLRYPMPYVGFLGRPGARLPGPPRMGGSAEDQVIQFNELGFRGPVPGAKVEGTFRVIVLGGSTVLNGAPLESSIPGQIQQLYATRGIKAEVFNWGVTSAVSGQELAILVHLMPRFSPDLVIAYDGANDVFAPFSYDPRPGVPYDWMVVETGLSLLRDGDSIRFWPAIIALRSRALGALARQSLVDRVVELQVRRNLAGYQTSPWAVHIADVWAENVTKMCSVARAFGARFAAFLQPSVATKEPQTGGEPQMLETRELQAHAAHVYALLKTKVETVSVTMPIGCSVSDVSDVLDGVDEQLYWDMVHVTNDGNRRIAAGVFNRLLEWGHQPSAP